MTDPSGMDSRERDAVLDLAERHGLHLTGDLDVNELGLDFRIVTAADRSGVLWVLRIPRRTGVTEKVEREARTLSMLRQRLPFAIPDWRIVTPELIAYPKLKDFTAISVDAATHEVTWNMDRHSDAFDTALGRSLAALHAFPLKEAVEGGLRATMPGEVRERVARDIDKVRSAFTIATSLEHRWRAWLDDDASWPGHSVVVHGDLYAGHILVNEKDEVTGMIDWTEAEIGDPSIDFSAHLLLFGEQGLDRLLRHYEAAGGRVWPGMAKHIAERLSMVPIRYALFALETGEPAHLEAAKEQLLPG